MALANSPGPSIASALVPTPAGRVALDVGAAAGGFTEALLDAGVRRVYAVDAGHGQLRGFLRVDPRVVNLERTNLAALDRTVVPEPIELITMDLSYLAVADAVPQLRPLLLAPGAMLLALVKPTFELHAPVLVAGDEAIDDAAASATKALLDTGWSVLGTKASPVRGSRGAQEVFVCGRRL